MKGKIVTAFDSKFDSLAKDAAFEKFHRKAGRSLVNLVKGTAQMKAIRADVRRRVVPPCIAGRTSSSNISGISIPYSGFHKIAAVARLIIGIDFYF